jgi:hypothetical protein
MNLSCQSQIDATSRSAPRKTKSNSESLAVAEKKPDQRPPRWPDVRRIKGPAIDSYLPERQKIQRISTRWADIHGNEVTITVPKSRWPALLELVANSTPVEIENELLIIAYATINTTDGKTYYFNIASDAGDPIIFTVRTLKRKRGSFFSYFATTKSERDVIRFFENLQDKRNRRRLAGWDDPQ